MISESRRMSKCKCVMYTIVVIIAQASSALAGNSQSQNAINPRNSSTVTPTGGKGSIFVSVSLNKGF